MYGVLAWGEVIGLLVVGQVFATMWQSLWNDSWRNGRRVFNLVVIARGKFVFFRDISGDVGILCCHWGLFILVAVMMRMVGLVLQCWIIIVMAVEFMKSFLGQRITCGADGTADGLVGCRCWKADWMF